MSSVYMAVTADQYELPVFQTDRAVEMAALLGCAVNTIYGALSRGNVLKSSRMQIRIIRVEIEDDDVA